MTIENCLCYEEHYQVANSLIPWESADIEMESTFDENESLRKSEYFMIILQYH